MLPSKQRSPAVKGRTMKQLSFALAALLLSACSLQASPLAMSPRVATALDAAARGGLAADVAARPSVQLSAPAAYTLTAASQPFVEALDRQVAPQRLALASAIEADATIQRGLAGWSRLETQDRLTLLERVAELTARSMASRTPPVDVQDRAAGSANVMAFFENDGSDLGRVVLYQDTIAGAGAEIAVATVIHEVRHAAQYQLMRQSPADADAQALAGGYSAAWQAIHQAGDESTLTYGDYAHLTIEFDAFQTGNTVAALLFGSRFDPTGLGFVDTHASARGAMKLDLLQLGATLQDAELIGAVNRAQAEAQASGSKPGQARPDFGRYRPRAGRAWR